MFGEFYLVLLYSQYLEYTNTAHLNSNSFYQPPLDIGRISSTLFCLYSIGYGGYNADYSPCHPEPDHELKQ